MARERHQCNHQCNVIATWFHNRLYSLVINWDRRITNPSITCGKACGGAAIAARKHKLSCTEAQAKPWAENCIKLSNLSREEDREGSRPPFTKLFSGSCGEFAKGKSALRCWHFYAAGLRFWERLANVPQNEFESALATNFSDVSSRDILNEVERRGPSKKGPSFIHDLERWLNNFLNDDSHQPFQRLTFFLNDGLNDD